jgi:hypothetical protein
MPQYTIKDLQAKTDQELMDLLGLTNTLNGFKEDLGEADALKGKAREDVEERINDMLNPRIYPNDLSYAIEDAKRRAAKTGKEALADDSPASVMD